MPSGIILEPQLPILLLAALILALVVFSGFGIVQGVRGGWFRLLASLALAFALLNPSLVREEREPLKSVAALIVDKTTSQNLNDRAAKTETLHTDIAERINADGRFELREVVVEDQLDYTHDRSTALFAALDRAFGDVADDRIAGAIMITDGQVHDVPAPDDFEFDAPLHALLSGSEGEIDRRIELVNAPKFGVVGETLEFSFKIVDTGFGGDGVVAVNVRANGEDLDSIAAVAGETETFVFQVPHGGKSILEFNAEAADREITLANNRAVATVNGIRENLRVLLVSGEPHAGERTWRNLLKSDSSVDLVHFTILRPPEKQDGTPINELSLIAFPTRELFVQKISEFDLIIFDRYQRRGVLPVLYFDNIATYIRDGGAVLVAAGPEFSAIGGISDTPLGPVIPARPAGSTMEQPYRATISEVGARHPVTRNLGNSDNWSRWFRIVGAEVSQGHTVLTGPDDRPLLVLGRADQGRVALLLSDHVWLWARGFEGGGPHVALLRRLSHWLMKEPELDEERLQAISASGKLVIERQTLGENPGPVTVTTPLDRELEVRLQQVDDGLWRAEVKTGPLGLYRASSGELSAFANVGPPSPREIADVVSTPNRIAPVIAATGGTVIRAEGGKLPAIVATRLGATHAGRNWIGLIDRQASILIGIERQPLFAGFLGLAMLLAAVAAMWAREGH